VIYPWDPASPHYTECTDSYTAHNNYITTAFGVTINPWVEISDLEGYQDFVFPTDQAWVDYINNFYNDPSLYGEKSVPDVPGLSRSTTVTKE
jgi:hypothetical protein